MDLRQSPVCWERGWRQTQLPRGECWAASLGQGCSGEPVPEPGPGWASCWVTLARDLPPFWVQFPFLSNEAGVGWGVHGLRGSRVPQSETHLCPSKSWWQRCSLMTELALPHQGSGGTGAGRTGGRSEFMLFKGEPRRSDTWPPDGCHSAGSLLTLSSQALWETSRGQPQGRTGLLSPPQRVGQSRGRGQC